CARLKTYGAFFGDKNHKAFSRFCLCGHEKSGLTLPKLNAENLSTGLAMLLPIARPSRDGQSWAGMHLLI
ncbi:hypothetical protein, partial [Pseudomonas sp.]|uniref:hypothetical protein n=1 Tax=Pseudomonas sp. TaxID=306 RepID=UPI00290E613F